MIVEAIYKHESPNRVSYQRHRESPEDEMFIRFIKDSENDSQLPFDDCMLPIGRFKEWLDEIDELYLDLANMADDEYNNLLEELEE